MFRKLLEKILVKNLGGKELTDEKIQDFKRLTLAQSGIILSLFLYDLFAYFHFPYYLEMAESIFFVTLGVYVFLLWDMLRNYTASRKVILLNFVFIMGVFFIGTIVANPFFPMPPTVPYRLSLALIQLCLLAVECTVIGYTLSEFFKKDLGMPIRLWGAACIYLMIGLAFGSVYEVLCVLNIRCFGVDIPLRTVGLMKRFGYSLTVLSGMNSPFGNAADMIFSMGTVEALWGQIFIVLIVARLLTK
jgi:hypothetical protein